MYSLEFTRQATKDLLRQTEKQAYKKLEKLLKELVEHPYTGTGKPEQLMHGRSGQWSKWITPKHRLVYTVNEEKITVLILTASGHYLDK